MEEDEEYNSLWPKTGALIRKLDHLCNLERLKDHELEAPLCGEA